MSVLEPFYPEDDTFWAMWSTFVTVIFSLLSCALYARRCGPISTRHARVSVPISNVVFSSLYALFALSYEILVVYGNAFTDEEKNMSGVSRLTVITWIAINTLSVLVFLISLVSRKNHLMWMYAPYVLQWMGMTCSIIQILASMHRFDNEEFDEEDECEPNTIRTSTLDLVLPGLMWISSAWITMNPVPVVIDQAGIRNRLRSGKKFVMVDFDTVDDDDDDDGDGDGDGDDPRNEREDDGEADLRRQIHLSGVPGTYADDGNDDDE